MNTDALIRSLARRPLPEGPDRALSLGLAATLGIGVMLAAAIWGARPDLAAMALSASGALKFAGMGAVLAAALAAARAASRPRAGMAAPLALVAALTGALAAALAFPEGRALALAAADCAVPILTLGALPLAALLAALRRGAPERPALAGAMAGLAAGAAGALAWATACPSDDPAHVAVTYGISLLASTAIGAALGRRLLAW